MAEMKLDNARKPEQRQKMEDLAREGKCFFCEVLSQGKSAGKILLETKVWFVRQNDYPYDGSVHHYMIVSKPHIATLREITPNARIELFSAIFWLEDHLGVKSESVFVRSGNMAFTGGTLDHLHFHFLVGTGKPEDATSDDWLTVTLGYKKKT